MTIFIHNIMLIAVAVREHSAYLQKKFERSSNKTVEIIFYIQPLANANANKFGNVFFRHVSSIVFGSIRSVVILLFFQRRVEPFQRESLTLLSAHILMRGYVFKRTHTTDIYRIYIRLKVFVSFIVITFFFLETLIKSPTLKMYRITFCVYLLSIFTFIV